MFYLLSFEDVVEVSV